MRLRWTEPAFQDLQNIFDYVGEHDGPAAARKIALQIYESLDSLVQFPRRGRIGRKPETGEFNSAGGVL